jgi:signal transduction histidine kinase/DNA-binding response OmpR family regulator
MLTSSSMPGLTAVLLVVVCLLVPLVGLGCGLWLRERRRMRAVLAERDWAMEEATKGGESLEKALVEVLASERRFRLMVEHMPVMIHAHDEAGNYVFWNRAAEEITGFTADRIVGNPRARDLLYPPSRTRERADAMHSMGDFRDIVLPVATADRQIRLISFSKVSGRCPIPGWDTWEIGIDVTEQARMEESLREASRRAEAAAQAKGEFLANMSHEVRTPLNAIVGMADIGQDRCADPELHRVFRTITAEAGALLAILNEVLDYSKMEAGHIEIEAIPFDLVYLLEDISAAFALRAQQKELDFVFSIAPDAPRRVLGDPGRLRQVLANLLGNALKFTDHGEIGLRVEPIEEYADLGAETAHVRFRVTDTGIGIPEDMQDAIFDSFTQVDSSIARRYGGTGLGTTICKRLVEMMGGEIGLSSVEGRGSAFWFRLPLAVQTAVEPEPELWIGLQGLSVLLVDDVETNRVVLRGFLESYGCRVDEAADGDQALEMLSSQEPRWDVVLSDGRMPRTDGFELAERMHEDERLAGLPMLLLTSAGRPGDAALCRELGIAGYLTKPVNRESLRRALERVLRRRAGEPAKQGSLVTRHVLAEQSRKPRRILVADDHPVNLEVAAVYLARGEYMVEKAADGAQALDCFRRMWLDAILMDVEMPHMDGLAATRAIREIERRHDGEARHTLIIAMTGHDEDDCADRCLEAGMDAVVHKPIDQHALLSLLDSFFHPPAEGEAAEAQAPMDLTEVMRQFSGRGEVVVRLGDSFAASLPEQIEELRAALGDGDMQKLATQAHRLSGAAANLVVQNLATASRRLENSARSDIVTSLGEEFDAVEEAAQAFLTFWGVAREDAARQVASE